MAGFTRAAKGSKSRRLGMLAGAAVVAAGSAGAWGQAVTYTKVMDTSMVIPGTTRTFQYPLYPAFDGTTIYWSAIGQYGSLFSGSGSGVNLLVSGTTPIPGSTATLYSVAEKQAVNGEVIFTSGVTSDAYPTDPNGLYKYSGGTVTRIYDQTTPVPGGSGNLSRYYWPSLSAGGAVTFFGMGPAPSYSRGLYSTVGGTLHMVADATTILPGQSTAIGTNGLQMRPVADAAGNILFSTSTRTYLQPVGGAITEAAAVRAGGNPSLDDGRAAFVASGVYADLGIGIKRIADTTTTFGTLGTYTGFSNACLSDDRVAFIATRVDRTDIYVYEDSEFRRILGTWDMLDGKMVWDLAYSGDLMASSFFMRDSFQGDKYAFGVEFADHNPSGGVYDFALYIATIPHAPEPASLSLLGAGAAILLCRQRRRRM